MNNMNKVIEIGGRTIGPNQQAYIIAEAGVNHNGDTSAALELVEHAKRAGADCVKFQTFKAEEIVTKAAPKANYQLKVTDPKESQLEMLKKLELRMDDYKKVIRHCKEQRIQFLSTPYNFNDVDFLNQLGVDGFKIASGQLVELPFLEYTAKLGKPMFVSTGMATLGEVESALNVIRSTGNEQIVILQCTTNYPSRIEDAHIRAMISMRDAFDVLTGYSDHTENNYSLFAATALGACVLEKHFTLSKNLPGPDHSCSLEPAEFAELVKGVRDIEKALGSSIKKPTDAETKNAVGMRRSIVSVGIIHEGDQITRQQVAFKRPATGLEPRRLNEVLGKTARRTIQP